MQDESEALMVRRDVETPAPMADGEFLLSQASTPLIVATILREKGITGVHTHFRQLSRYLEDKGRPAALVTPFSWGGPLIRPVFGVRYLLARYSGSANVWWYRHWHEVFLYQALRRQLATVDDCVIYVQCPVSARAALRARRGSHQRVVMAVHFRISQADEWANKDRGRISRGGEMFRAIRAYERDVIPRVDGLVYVSHWAERALTEWLPNAAAVPSTVVDNFIAPLKTKPRGEPIGDLVTVGNLEAVKNHRYMLQVLAEAKRAGFSYTLDVFGEGPLKQELQRQARYLGLNELVRMHGFRSDVRNLLPGYRAYIHASYSESSSFAIIEAMAAGLPIVAGDTGPLSELYDEGVEGRFWPLDDPARAAAVLIGLMEDKTERSMAADAALARFRRDFDAEVIAPRLLSFVVGADGARERRQPGTDRVRL
jgi:glycosyltransferase involved in cell wall biosynthesis